MSSKPVPWAIVTQAHARPHQLVFEELARRLGPAVLLCGRRVGDGTPELEVRQGPPYVKGSLPVRAASWLRFAGWAAGQLLTIRPRFVLVVTNPPIFPHVAWFIRQLRCHRMRFGVLVWDVYPKGISDVGILPKHHPLLAAWRLANRVAFQQAEFLVALSSAMARAVVEEGGPRQKIRVFPNWADTEEFRPVERQENRFLGRYGLLRHFVLLYAGNLGYGHSLDGLIQAAKSLESVWAESSRRPAFLFVGEGAAKERLRRLARDLGVQSARFLPFQPDPLFPDTIAAADLAVVAMRPGLEGTALPSKLYTAMAAGRPILALCEEESELADLVRRYRMGWVAHPADHLAIERAIREAAADDEARVSAGLRARAYCERYHSVGVAVEWFERLLRPYVTEEGPPV